MGRGGAFHPEAVATGAAYLTGANAADALKSIGYGYISLCVKDAKDLLNDTPGKLGMPSGGSYLLAAIDYGVMLSILTGQDYAKTAALVGAAWAALNGIPCYLMPQKFTEMWGLSTKSGGVEEV